MTRPPIESWKGRPPSDADEARAAELLRKVGGAETLSPQAQHRVAHRLRSQGHRRVPLFSDVRFAAGAVAILILFVSTALATIHFFDRQAEVAPASSLLSPNGSQVASASSPPLSPNGGKGRGEGESRTLADRTLALNDTPPEALRLEEPELRLDSKSGRHKLFTGDVGGDERSSGSNFAQPPTGSPRDGPLRRSDAPAMKKAAALPAQAVSQAQGGISAPASASHAPLATGPDACAARIPAYSRAIASNEGDLEQALFGRGTCLLRTGDRKGGSADLRTYLARFPDGRFAAQARSFLANAAASSSPP